MRLLKFHLCILLVLLGFTSGLFSCNPVKQVLLDPQKFAQVRDTVFARGLCLNDTVTTEVVRDTIIYQQVVGKADSTHVTQNGTCEFDTYVDGTRVQYRSGVVKVTLKPTQQQVQLKTVVKTNTVRDKARENVLEKQVVQVRTQMNAALEDAHAKYSGLNDQLTEAKLKLAKLKNQRLLLLAALAGLGLFAFRKPLAALIL